MFIEQVHCLFEQSGTFKNEFIKLGIPSFDYDILNDFKQTDFVVDIFQEIELAYNGSSSLFDSFCPGDLVIAFFPCVRFENQSLLLFRCDNIAMKNWTYEKKLEYDLKLGAELFNLYSLINKLVIVCIRKNLKLIIENPYSSQHFLTTHWSLKPSLIDLDRRDRGDYYKKPTQYWFINCIPSHNLIWEALEYPEYKTVVYTYDKVERSLISPIYANKFIREFIL